MLKKTIILLFALALLASIGCQQAAEYQAPNPSNVEHPEWTKNANIYEVNIRQWSEEGTFDEVTDDLPRLKEMGVDILWLMPIHPIGEVERKGTKGSYYAVQDYKAVNPEFGTEEDFRELVDKAHELEMKVIIDWVANHTAWDNVWTVNNKEWYTLTEEGGFQPPVEDWSDVIDLNYDNSDMREAMLDALVYWVDEFDIDGYRCDVAMMVPTEFWNEVRSSLDEIKPVFMLAEAEQADHHEEAFDMSYAWEFHHVITGIASGERTLAELDELMEKEAIQFDGNAYRMYFTSNHDENSWKGSDLDMFGENFLNFAVLAATLDGMPLIYTGQESGLEEQLEFFEKDLVDWGEYKYADFYKTLLNLKHENEALWNGNYGGSLERIDLGSDMVYAYKRVKGESEVLVVLNFGNETATLSEHDVLSIEGMELILGDETDMSGISPHSHYVYAK